MASQTIKIAISGIVIAAAASYLMADTLLADPEALTYFHMADEVMSKQEEFLGQRIRMGGHVMEGSILQKKGTLQYIFDVKPVPQMMKYPAKANETIEVRYTGVVPDTFKDDAEVIVTGKLGADGIFHATDLLAKCPSKYEAEEKNKGTY